MLPATVLAVRGSLAGACALGLFVYSIASLPLSPITLGWLVTLAEVAFGVHYCFLLRQFASGSDAHMPDDYDPQLTKDKMLKHLQRVDDVKECMKSWFINAEHWDDVKRDNLLELFAYAIYYRTIDQMRSEGLMCELEDLVTRLEAHLGSAVPVGCNPRLRFMSHLWEPLRHVYRPLVFYAVMELLALLCHIILAAAGFKLHHLGGISYYTLNMGPQQLVAALTAAHTPGTGPKSESHPKPQSPSGTSSVQNHGSSAEEEEDSDSLPLVFLHGVGAGLLPYLALVFHLAALGRPMILPESKHVSMRLVSWLPTVDDMADGTAAIMAAHGVKRAVVAAHSYGTMVASRLVLKYEGLVHSLCLMDPVCFAMFMPNLVRNFLYTRHNSGCIVIDVIMALVSSELHCARSFSRNFFWTRINMWEEHIPERTLVVLSGRDILAPTAQVHKWLTEHTHAQVLYRPSMAHAGVLVNLSWQATIIEAFKQVVQRPAGSPAAAAAVTAAVEADTAAEVAAAAEECSQAEAEQQQQQQQEQEQLESCAGGTTTAPTTATAAAAVVGDGAATVCGGAAGSALGATGDEASSSASDIDSTDDDTAWESLHDKEQQQEQQQQQDECVCGNDRSCSCLNCQLFPFSRMPDVHVLRGCCDATVCIAPTQAGKAAATASKQQEQQEQVQADVQQRVRDSTGGCGGVLRS